jgi:ribosomal protein L7/L12
VDLTTIIIAAVVVAAAVAVTLAVLRRTSGVVVAPVRPEHGAASPRDVAGLLAAGKKIEAIKLARQQTGLGLKEAKDYVEALERGEPVTPLPPRQSSGAPGGPSSALMEQAARALVAQGKKIEAIKLVRQQTGWGLKEAKDYVDGLG